MYSSNNCPLTLLLIGLSLLISNGTSVKTSSSAKEPVKDSISRNTMGYTEEYCELETFRPQCLKNEVIVIESAIYGRRYVSRCLETEELDFASNPGYLGCSADVVDYVNTVCSGRKQCEIRIPDANLQHTKPCPKGLDMFLEIRYECVEVVEEDRSCVVSLTSSPLHIAKTVPSIAPQSNTGLYCGTRTQPWLLEAPAGQRINISLIDFTPTSAATALSLTSDLKPWETTRPSSSSGSGSGSGSRGGGCITDQQTSERYGYIIDKSAAVASKKNITLCRGSQRLSNVYLSSSNVVEIVLGHASGMNAIAFLVRIEAIGCSDLVPPEDAWLKRTDNEAIIGCYTSRQTWHLKCEDRRWIGVVSNCTKHTVLDTLDVLRQPNEVLKISNHQVLMLVAVCFLGIAVCLAIICCGVYCLRSYTPPAKLDSTNSSAKYSHVRAAGNCDSRLTTTVNGTEPHRSHTLDSNGATVAVTGGWNATSPTPQYYVLEQTN